MAKNVRIARILVLTAMLAHAQPYGLAGDAEAQRESSAGAGSACRTYATADTMALSSSNGVTVKAAKTCNYNTATNEFACTIKYTDNLSISHTTITTLKFASVADFVGDAPRVSLFGSHETHPMSAVTRVDTSGLRSTTNATYSYDAQRRPTGIAMRSDPGGSSMQTFTAWDTYGRPTVGMTGKSRSAYAYNDAERTATITNLDVGTVVTQTFDANGLQIRQTSRSPGGNETSTWTIHSTAQICR